MPHDETSVLREEEERQSSLSFLLCHVRTQPGRGFSPGTKSVSTLITLILGLLGLSQL